LEDADGQGGTDKSGRVQIQEELQLWHQ